MKETSSGRNLLLPDYRSLHPGPQHWPPHLPHHQGAVHLTLASVSSHPLVHLVCSIDHTGIWDQQWLSKLNLIWLDCTSPIWRRPQQPDCQEDRPVCSGKSWEVSGLLSLQMPRRSTSLLSSKSAVVSVLVTVSENSWFSVSAVSLTWCTVIILNVSSGKTVHSQIDQIFSFESANKESNPAKYF